MICGANNKISIFRVILGAKETYSDTPTVSDVDCYLEQLDPQVAAILDDQNAFQTFKAYIDGIIDVEISDKIIDADSITYIASGVQKFQNNIDTPNQTEIIMVKKYVKN